MLPHCLPCRWVDHHYSHCWDRSRVVVWRLRVSSVGSLCRLDGDLVVLLQLLEEVPAARGRRMGRRDRGGQGSGSG